MDVDKIGPSEHELREEFEKGLQESSLGRWAQARDPDAAAQAVQRLASRYVGEMQLPVVDRPGFLQISKPPPTTGWVVFLMSFVVLWLAASVAGLIQHVVDPLLRDHLRAWEPSPAGSSCL